MDSSKKQVATKAAAATKDSASALAEALVTALDSVKGIDVVLIDVRGKTSITDFLVIASGNSDRHLMTMKEAVCTEAAKRRVRPIGVEGEGSDWLLVDFGDCVVHLVRPEARAFYDLERLWSVAAGPETE